MTLTLKGRREKPIFAIGYPNVRSYRITAIKFSMVTQVEKGCVCKGQARPSSEREGALRRDVCGSPVAMFVLKETRFFR